MIPAVVASGGVGIATRTGSGSVPGVLLVHATGFCKEIWDPVIDEMRVLGDRRMVVVIDQRGHGDSGVPHPPFDWWDLGRDVLAVAAEMPGGPGLGVGHSAGAAAMIMAEILAPRTFEALLLIEPIVFPPPYGREETHLLAQGARRRRPSFTSYAEAIDSYRGRGVFAGWDERALVAYVAHGFRQEDDRWTLKCRPEVEAEFYRGSSAHAAWNRLGEVVVPAVVVAGAESDSHPEPVLREQARGLAQATATVVPGTSHFVPMERPAAVAEIIGGLGKSLRP